ncbi:hypothetical protein SLEP1_g18984 [Rubroshorea leprosula]|uniref:Ribosomal protein L32 n=1 Tax=Rubroshorea leprosula TaxID=152421 RepID=A0AAV5J9X3_9ROSI|nr:hypothetical protein SLEP1_g18984 [Rubroshorea leprosula]
MLQIFSMLLRGAYCYEYVEKKSSKMDLPLTQQAEHNFF